MRKGHVPAAVPAEKYLLKRLLDPETAAAYLSIAAADEDPAAFMQALRSVTEAYGGVARMAKRAGLNRQQLYRTLSATGNPELRTLMAILKSAGFGFSVVPLDAGERKTVATRTTRARAVLPVRNVRMAARAPQRRAPPRASRAAA